MNEQKTGRFLPTEPDKAQLIYDAFRMLSGNPSFAEIVSLIEKRLEVVDSTNRQRGQENQYTEAQAWSWFLAAYRNSAAKGEVKTMDLQR
jgi:hypothetical protein